MRKINFARARQTVKTSAMSRPRLIALLLALVTLVVYLPVVHCDFVNFDDQTYVVENHQVQAGLSWPGIAWAFTTFRAANWHPLTWLSHMTDCTLFGLNPAAHHLVNVVIHAANAALLFLLLLRLTGSLWPCAWIAALFAWHPLHVESVAWIAERKDVLSTFFALLALLGYADYAMANQRRGYWLAWFCFCLSLMAKPMYVTLPFLMLLLDVWPLERVSPDRFDRRAWTRLAGEKLPFLLPVIADSIVTYLAQRNGAAVMTLAQLSLGVRLQIALIAYGRYLLDTVWPLHLAVLYPLPNHFSWIHKAAVVATGFLLLVSWSAWRIRTRHPHFIIGWLWFLGTLVPVIGLVKVGSMAFADRYTYFPLVGIFLAIAFGARDLAVQYPSLKKAIATAAILCLPACIALTENQIRFWHNSETLFAHTVAVTSDNPNALVNLGAALEMSGHLPDALARYQAAAHLADDNVNAHFNIANVLVKLGRVTEALPEFHRAITLDPTTANLHNGLGLALADLNRFNEATNEFAMAARLDPENPWPHVETARVLLKLGRDAGAIDELRTALRIEPDNFQILVQAAHVLAADQDPSVRDGGTALALALKANVLTDGVQPLVLDVLGMACAEAGRFDEAREAAQKALDIAQAAQMKDLDPIRQRLALYTHNQPWRESFLATNTNSNAVAPTP